MRRQPLLKLLQNLRHEVRESSNPAHGSSARDGHVFLLQRTQEWLYDDVAWSHMRVERFVDAQAGQRYYVPPRDIPIERVERVEVRYGSDWVPLHYGIEPEHLSIYDSDVDVRAWPVERWCVHEDDQIEVWPIPAQNGERYANPQSPGIEGRMRITGIRRLNPLVEDGDLADLDDRLIVLHAAAEILAARGAKDAGLKAQAAADRKRDLIGQMSKRKTFRMFGGGEPARDHRARPATIHYRDREPG